MGNSQSKEFESKKGSRQGGVLSSTLFNIMQDIIIKEKVKKLQVGYRNIEMVTLTECAFAKENINLKINMDKTKVMIMGKMDLNVEIKWKNRQKQVFMGKDTQKLKECGRDRRCSEGR